MKWVHKWGFESLCSDFRSPPLELICPVLKNTVTKTTFIGAETRKSLHCAPVLFYTWQYSRLGSDIQNTTIGPKQPNKELFMFVAMDIS
jgi:hypothetical protein